MRQGATGDGSHLSHYVLRSILKSPYLLLSLYQKKDNATETNRPLSHFSAYIELSAFSLKVAIERYKWHPMMEMFIIFIYYGRQSAIFDGNISSNLSNNIIILTQLFISKIDQYHYIHIRVFDLFPTCIRAKKYHLA